MLFKRRDKQHWVETLRSYVLPRAGWKRTLIYFGHRVRRIPDSPTRIARGISFGVFTSFSPFFGFHILLALLLCKLFRGNMFAAAAGTAIGNPFTFPIIIASALKLGTFLLGTDPATTNLHHIGQDFQRVFHALWRSLKALFGVGHSQMADVWPFIVDVMLPYILGGALIGLVFAVGSFYITRPLIIAYQNIRRKKLALNGKKKQGGG